LGISFSGGSVINLIFIFPSNFVARINFQDWRIVPARIFPLAGLGSVRRISGAFRNSYGISLAVTPAQASGGGWGGSEFLQARSEVKNRAGSAIFFIWHI